MAELLHEYWESENGQDGEFGPVKARSDEVRPSITPHARLIFSLYASTWHQAMQLYQERLDYGDYQPPEGVSDYVYTDAEKAEQDNYLNVRNSGWK